MSWTLDKKPSAKIGKWIFYVPGSVKIGYMGFMIRRFTLVATVLFFLSGCNQKTSTDAIQQPTPQEKINSLVYPHSKDFFETHGQTYLKEKQQCIACHGQDSSGGTAKVSCSKCHSSYPHPANIADPKEHSALFQNPKFIGQCVSCHTEQQGRTDRKTCTSCHAGYPHGPDWALPNRHGSAALKAKKSCTSCHDTKKSATAISCQSCHAAYPHNEDFKQGDHSKIAKTYEGNCTTCHSDYKKHMSGQGCIECHDGKINIHWATEKAMHTEGSIKRLPGSSKSKK